MCKEVEKIMGNHQFSFVCDFCFRQVIYGEKYDYRDIHPFAPVFGKMQDCKVVTNNITNEESNIEICSFCVKKIISFINEIVIVKEKK